MGQPKTVIGIDDRVWDIHMKIMWTDNTEPFEHEMEGGRRAVISMMVLLGLMTFLLVSWSFEVSSISIPWWVKLTIALIVLFFPVRWALRRPRRLIVEGGVGPDNLASQTWSAEIRGRGPARAERTLAIRTLKKRGTPARANSPLQPQ